MPAGAVLPALLPAPLTHLLHQGFVFLRKTACDVREVEFARALRLGQSSLEPVAFRVPRVKVVTGLGCVGDNAMGSPHCATSRRKSISKKTSSLPPACGGSRP